MRSERALVTLAMALLTLSAHALVPEAVVDVPTRGVTQRFLYLQPASPVANVILLPGSDGVLRLRSDGSGEKELLESGAVSRNRQRFAEQGFAVAVVDAPSDKQVNGMSPYRQSTEMATDLLAIIGFLRERSEVPVWLVGHDGGAVSAMFAALNLPVEQRAGIVSIAGPTQFGNSLLNMPLRQVRRPVLVISHASDTCSPLAQQVRVVDELEAVPVKQHVVLTGGDNISESCGYGYHQFDGLDDDLVSATAEFVRKYNPLVAPPATTATAVEYYHAGFDHYFVTWVVAEIANLDSGATTGWARTGQSYQVFTAAQGGTSAVCRIYIPPGQGDGHFFGRDANECDGTMQKNPTFVLEAPAFFHLFPPSQGSCAAGQVPVYRVFSNRADANHRYMTDRALRDQMVASGWLAEGDGPDLVVMCAPA